MKLRLVQTGGFAGLRKSAEKIINWNEVEVANFKKQFAHSNEPSQIRDGFYYSWELEQNNYDINPENLSGKYLQIFDELRKALKAEPK